MKHKLVFVILFLVVVLGGVLRLYRLGTIPPGLSEDEASLGYSAYTILTTGRDEHGEKLPIARFVAFGDYKPPGYIYSAVPTIFLLGLNEVGVRLPSALSGIFLIIVTYLIVEELFRNKRLALLSSFLIAVSPWSIQLSRAAFEANLAVSLNAAAIIFFLYGKKKGWWLVSAVIAAVFSFYTFNANRIIAPLILGLLTLFYIRDVWRNKKWFMISCIVGLLLFIPSIPYLNSRESKIRFQEVSIFFFDIDKLRQANDRIALDKGSILSKILHNRRVVFGLDYLKHYTDNFDLRFLFVNGDVNRRLSVQNMGELYVWELVFLLFGLTSILRRPSRSGIFLLLWWLIVPIPAGSAKETPHALRTASVLPVPQIVIAIGLLQILEKVTLFYQYINKMIKKIIIAAVVVLFICNFYYYLHFYFIHYAMSYSSSWQYGYREALRQISQLEDKYDYVVITKNGSRPYIYVLFYKQFPLDKYLNSQNTSRDWWGLWNVESFGKYYFNFADITKLKGKILVVESPNEAYPGEKLISQTFYLDHGPAYKIVEITK